MKITDQLALDRITKLVRASIRHVKTVHMKSVTEAMAQIYLSPTELQAEYALDEFRSNWGREYRHTVVIWHEGWTDIKHFLLLSLHTRQTIFAESKFLQEL